MLIKHRLENMVIVPTHKCGETILMAAYNDGKSDLSQKCHDCSGKPWTVSYMNGLTTMLCTQKKQEHLKGPDSIYKIMVRPF